jgi:hypothetical protein
MEDNKALGIVSALANGVNPLTGEVFDAESPYQSPEIVRALFVAARALGGAKTGPAPNAQPTRQRPQSPNNVGKPWTSEEDQRLLTEFDRGCTPRELASQHGRTLAGIEARLEKHGRIGPQQRETSNRFPRMDQQESRSPQPSR